MPVPGQQFLRFCFVGAIGFAVDSGITMLLTRAFQCTPLLARIGAFLVAATVTFALNRSFTFESGAGADSWFRYVFLTAIGGFINVGVYMGWLAAFGTSAFHVLSGIALGSIAAMGFNFTVSRRFVFVVR